ncbi:PREDICTED: leucine-rich repeat-containing protein 56 [Drosophila arizonae]|uniref:Leucine-rich repeat-containing protein 56 n=1 Tax=Drosophila arizonae TaxID=7263 RepID=A0ABM1P229_DROAR|nr:PREDICTED: leucine-rich repeat-containing protein 56 [Drosophila arizonae]
MPVLEAPAEYSESSPEHSLQPEVPLLLAPLLPGPAALAQLRPPTAEARQQQQHQQQLQVERQNRRLLERRNSFDRDEPIVEETEHFPAFVHLLPVVLPPQLPEPTLDELLRRVTQRTDLEQVETVRLRVISYSVSLSRLSLFLPRLQQLDLSGSVLSSLRDLGYGLTQLTHLNISNCGLNSFDGTSGVPNLRVLIADGNMIQRVGPLTELSQLQMLQARNNRISELGLLSFLGLCPQLTEVELSGNPVCRLPLYRDMLRRSVATLQILDGQSINEDPPEALSAEPDDNHSSFSSDSESAPRPATAPQNNNNNNNAATRRAASAFVTLDSTRYQRQSSTSSTPVAGSVLGLVRQRRRRSGHAWVSSSSGSSSGSSSAGSTRAPSISSDSSHSSLDMHSAAYTFNAHGTFD